MITQWEIYWITRLDGIKEALFNISNLFLICVLIFGIISGSLYIAKAEGIKVTVKTCRCFVWLWSILLFLAISLWFFIPFIPSSTDAAMIKLVPSIVNNKKLQSECKEIYFLAKKGLKNLIDKQKE